MRPEYRGTVGQGQTARTQGDETAIPLRQIAGQIAAALWQRFDTCLTVGPPGPSESRELHMR